MAKRKQQRRWRETEVPKHWLRLYKPAPDGTNYIPVADRAFWIDPERRKRSGSWINAIERIDKFGDKGPLLALLKSDVELPDDVRCIYLPDLIARGVPRPAPKPPTPAYDLTEREERLILASNYVRAYQKGVDRLSFADAVTRAAKEWSADRMALESFCRKTGGSYRSLKARLAALKPATSRKTP
jgi:hypothetical protein